MSRFLLLITLVVLLALTNSEAEAKVLRVDPQLQTVQVGEQFTVTVEWISNSILLGGTFDVAYDASLLEFIDYAYGDLGDPFFNSTPVITEGLIGRLGIGKFAGLGEGVVVTLTFILREPGQAFMDVVAHENWTDGFMFWQPETIDGAVSNAGFSRSAFPDSVSIEDIALGETVEYTLELSSVGSAPLEVFDVVVPDDQIVFSLVTDSCSGLTLQVGESCFVTVNALAFEFGSGATYSIRVDFMTSDVLDRSDNTLLVLRHLRPQLQMPRVEFYDAPSNAPYRRQLVPITNVGVWPADMSHVRIDGNNRANVILLENRCKGELLQVGESCGLLLEFRPTIARQYTASYVVRYGNEVLTQRANIVGYTPTGLPFRDQRAVTDWVQTLGKNDSRSIEIINKGTAPLTFTTSSVQSSNGFSVTDNCTGITLLPGELCSIDLLSTHTIPGTYIWSGWIRTDSLAWAIGIPLAADLTVTAR